MDNLLRLKSFVKPYWKQSLLSLVLLSSVVLMDLAIPRLIQQIIDRGIGQKDIEIVIHTTLIMLGISLLSALFAIGNNLLSVQVGEGFARDLRETLFLRIQSFSFGNLDRLVTGQFMVRLTSDVAVLQRVVRMLLRIGTRAPMLMIGSLILMVSTNRSLAFTMLPLLIVTAVVMVTFISKMGNMFLAAQEKLDRLNTVLQENIAGVRVVKAFVRTEFESDRFEDANDDFTYKTIRVMQLMATLSPLITVLINIGIVILIWGGGIGVINGDLSIGEIIAFTNYLMTTLTPLMIMAMLSTVLAGGMASAERIFEILDAAPEVEDHPDAILLPENTSGQIIFKDVGFHYNGANAETVLEGINLVAEPGETIAILGATGSGKTSLVNLVPRFYDISEGQLFFDGIDVRRIQQDSLLSHVGVVPQESVLFSGTVRDNICYGRLEAPEQDIIAVAKAAQVHDFILDLPDGYDTHVEQRGVNLSGGQKQRIAIARALLTLPKILILDDSTSSVDVETENKIQSSLKKWLHSSTSFVIAQRISTVLNADKIIVIDKGHIVAEGTHKELMHTSPIYQEIYNSQLGDGANLE
ncbi:MAG: multidrug ABC transporter ATP-binding protein [Chloroflexi bacterium RBG_16_48_8]|nr:MAG: multidrug ABC transporter ATP-binding protein [Chloroflexi bacterium RBG_16_48_8]